MRDDCKFFWLFLTGFMCLTASVSHTRAANLNEGACTEHRFQGQGELLILARETVIERHELELEELKIELDALVQKLDITPVTASLDYQVSNTSSLTNPLSKYKSETSGISFKYDLHKISKEAKQTLIRNNIDVISSKMRSLRGKHAAEKIVALNDIVESQILDKILLERLGLVEKKIEYYKSLSFFGELKSEEISLAQTEFIEIRDKLLANKIKRNEKLFFLGLDKVSLDIPNSANLDTPTVIESGCAYKTESAIQIELAIVALETNLDLKHLIHRMSVSASISINQNRVNHDFRDEVQAGLSISVPILDGGVTGVEKNEITQKIYLEKNRLRNAKKVEISEVELRRNTEKVLISSLQSLSKKASVDLARYQELQERLKMGESVFIEKSNKRKEYLETMEAFLRLRYDIIAGWYEFLGRLDGFSEI